jgi:hypothetical protein
MAANAAPAVSDNPARPAGAPTRVPPEERFWKRYSAHGELPLSGASSFAIHVLVVGFLILWAVYLAALFSRPTQSLPVEVVRLETGGGGGSRNGAGDGPGVGHRAEAAGKDEETKPGKEEGPRKPNLEEVQVAEIKKQFTAADVRYIQEGPPSMAAFSRLGKEVRDRIKPHDGPTAGQGQGGSGRGGGRGDGSGTGTGEGRGEGKARLTQREKRMLRWSMSFNTNNGPDYLAQLRGLGAILAIPVKEGAEGREYKIVRDLTARPAKLLDEDLSKIQRIYWVDEKPQSVNDVMSALGLNLRPSHFVAFMPQELEEKLFQMEKAYKGLSEDQIHETKFRVERTGRGYEPRVVSQTPKSR